MYRLILSNWKAAALWAIILCASIGYFFSDGGGHEKLDQSAEQIRTANALAQAGAAPAEVQPVDEGDQEAEPEEEAEEQPLEMAEGETAEITSDGT